MKTWFTSDWHLGEDRIGINGKPNLFYRPFSAIPEQNRTITREFIGSGFEDGDELWHLGDVLQLPSSVALTDFGRIKDAFDELQLVRDTFPKSKFNLIIGNYDEDKMDILENYFDTLQKSWLVDIKDREYYLNHYPVNCENKEWSLTAHVHSLWKVRRNMINVGVDAWHFRPIDEDTIDFCRTACEKHYDQNVFI